MTGKGLTAVPGIRVGHHTDRVGLTGCTVVLCPPGTVGSGEVRGGAPGTRETDVLRPGTLVREVHAVLLTGGSAFGLAAADGVMRYLEERGLGLLTPVARVPIVPAAVLFDLAVGDPGARPGPAEGYAACDSAGEDVEEGSVGAGTGATVAKLAGPDRAAKGGVGTAARHHGDVVIGALAAVNAFGEVVDEQGEVLAGVAGGIGDAEPWQPFGVDPPQAGGRNTTLVVLATTARLTKERAHLLALAGHEGIDRAVRPAHTLYDGDAVFSLATGEVDADQRALEAMAVDAAEEAIRRGVRAAADAGTGRPPG